MSRDGRLLELRGITKSFPGVRALDRVDFDLEPGEVHALLGENGAGKSTLMKILSGSLRKDAGTIVVDGRPVDIAGPQHAMQLGIGMVYQELSLVPTLTVAENIFLGRWERTRGRIRWDRIHRAAAAALQRVGSDIRPHQLVRQLSMAEQQLVEIAKVLSRDARILLLDEPTSALSERETERLFEIIRRLKREGVGIVYVTHRLAEVMAISDRVTVLRDGRRIATVATREVSQLDLVRMMVGRELRQQHPKERRQPGGVLLSVRDLSTEAGLRGISFQVRAGEIVGVFGAMGAGRTELARALFGLDRVRGGEIRVDGRLLRLRGPADAIRAGMGYLTEDRRQGLVMTLPIPPNVTLASLPAVSRLGFLRSRREAELAERMVRELRVATPGLDRRVGHLSGGNQQKVALARWLVSQARVLIFDEPTRGVDVGARAEVYGLMNELARGGAGILMLSSDLPEVLGMSDRVLVMQRGRITAEFTHETATAEAVMQAAVGAAGAEVPA